MIKKIICAGILLCLFIAIPLAIVGIKKVEPGITFNAFLVSLNKHYEAWKLDIPYISQIDLIKNASGWTLILNFLINVWNIITRILNILITIINVLINIIQFICTFLYEIGFMIGTLIANGDSKYNWAWSGFQPYVPVV